MSTPTPAPSSGASSPANRTGHLITLTWEQVQRAMSAFVFTGDDPHEEIQIHFEPTGPRGPGLYARSGWLPDAPNDYVALFATTANADQQQG